MCRSPRQCWNCTLSDDEIMSIFVHMWECTYSVHTFFNLIEATYTVAEEKDIYLRLSREGLLDNW